MARVVILCSCSSGTGSAHRPHFWHCQLIRPCESRLMCPPPCVHEHKTCLSQFMSYSLIPWAASMARATSSNEYHPIMFCMAYQIFFICSSDNGLRCASCDVWSSITVRANASHVGHGGSSVIADSIAPLISTATLTVLSENEILIVMCSSPKVSQNTVCNN